MRHLRPRFLHQGKDLFSLAFFALLVGYNVTVCNRATWNNTWWPTRTATGPRFPSSCLTASMPTGRDPDPHLLQRPVWLSKTLPTRATLPTTLIRIIYLHHLHHRVPIDGPTIWRPWWCWIRHRPLWKNIVSRWPFNTVTIATGLLYITKDCPLRSRITPLQSCCSHSNNNYYNVVLPIADRPDRLPALKNEVNFYFNLINNIIPIEKLQFRTVHQVVHFDTANQSESFNAAGTPAGQRPGEDQHRRRRRSSGSSGSSSSISPAQLAVAVEQRVVSALASAAGAGPGTQQHSTLLHPSPPPYRVHGSASAARRTALPVPPGPLPERY